MRSIVLFLVFIPTLGFSQASKQPDAARIKLNLKKLNVLSSVLYVAAHPDDENTRIITYLANDCLSATAYLSMTRGDGGQNLIGAEIRDQLGLIRTQELLAARRIDGGQQFFTRANDFGFSKSATETFRIWGKDEIMSDVVKIFRQYQPDVIITRFPPDERAGHGHHTASAILAQEAFDAAADASQFPFYTKQYGTWQTKRLYTNTGRWWNTTINENTPGIISLNVGGYSPLLGTSFTEIAAISRSQHRSQGFGSEGTRGDQLEFLEFIKGDKAEKNIFEGINTTWSRLKGGEKVQPLVTSVIQNFNEEKPEASVPALIQIRKEILKLQPGIWKERKLKEVENLIQDCLGLFIAVTADNYWASPAEKITTSFELVNRSGTSITINSIQSPSIALDTTVSMVLNKNAAVRFKTSKVIDARKSYSPPYWLAKPHDIGIFSVTDATLIGKPENDPAIEVTFLLTVGEERLVVTQPVIFKWTDPAKGELVRPVEIVPQVFVNVNNPVFLFKDNNVQQVAVTLKSGSAGALKGTLQLDVPKGWRTEPVSVSFDLARSGAEVTKLFSAYPSSQEESVVLRAVATVNGKVFDQRMETISYDHIPTQTLMPPAEAKVVRLDLKKEGQVIGYIKGAGDDIPASLRHMGYDVLEMRNEEVTLQNLKRVQAVVLGVRALNTNDRMRFMMPVLMRYVKEGGTLVVQYNNSSAGIDSIGPYPFTLSRDRVTEENAAVRILKPDHRVLNVPNKITAKDFDGWVQERGLYFPNQWDTQYDAILSMNDTGEPARDGSLLVANYGQGCYVYTSLSFFRELPEGVAGAYKLFANLVSLRQPVPEISKGRKRKTGRQGNDAAH